jgi:kynureninase
MDLDPEEHIIELLPRAGEVTLRTEDIETTLTKYKDEIALVLLGAVNYYTGQLFDIKKISDCCQKNGLTLGLDLAHAMGNVELKLHDWNIKILLCGARINISTGSRWCEWRICT